MINFIIATICVVASNVFNHYMFNEPAFSSFEFLVVTILFAIYLQLRDLDDQ